MRCAASVVFFGVALVTVVIAARIGDDADSATATVPSALEAASEPREPYGKAKKESQPSPPLAGEGVNASVSAAPQKKLAQPAQPPGAAQPPVGQPPVATAPPLAPGAQAPPQYGHPPPHPPYYPAAPAAPVVVASQKEEMSPFTAILIGLFPFLVSVPAVCLWVYYIYFGEADLLREMNDGARMVEDLGKTCDQLEEDFLVFLDYCIQHPENLGGAEANAELSACFKQFVQMWLTVFRECSRAPHDSPFDVIPPEEFDGSCPEGVSKISEWVKAKLKGVSVGFVDLCANRLGGRRVSAWMHQGDGTIFMSGRKTQSDSVLKKTKQLRPGFMPNWLSICGSTENYLFVPREDRPPEDQRNVCPMEFMLCFNCFRLNFISPTHTSILLYWGLLIASGNYAVTLPGGVIGGTVIGAAWFLTTYILYKFESIDAVAQLQNTQRVLRQEQDDVMRLQKELDSFYNNVDEVSRIWQNRTRPRLDVMKQMMRMLSETHWRSLEASKEYLEACVLGLGRIESGVGPLRLYKVGKFGLGKTAQSVIRLQLEKITETIRNSDAREVVQNANGFIRCPNLLAVRVLACHQLPVGSWCDTYDPCVRMRIKKEAEWQKTECRDNDNSPRWHTEKEPVEFRFLIDNFGRELEVQVMDGNTVTSDTFMGEIKMQIDDMGSGGWRRISKTLQDPIDPSCPGLIELDVFLARDANDLRQLMPDTSFDINDEAFLRFMEEAEEELEA
eukprot:TRINITY_DN18651_c0_g1_i2.p1 TRINITY_DN18651_c0_g1~~TRINITY_DN18651_c0_g1_i2.p1  ORF type:complete len:730 (-),score=190.39 TRINITY_DN18651_c0_g1_i2:93-2282(-)